MRTKRPKLTIGGTDPLIATDGTDGPGSKPLPNPKHEAVVQAYIADPQHIGWRAYKSVYTEVTQQTAAMSFSRLMLRNDKFKERIHFLNDSISRGVVTEQIMSAQEVLIELSRLGRSNMQDYMRIGDDGIPALDFSGLTREQAAALGELTVEDFKDGRSDKREVRRVRFKLVPKAPALEILARHHGLLKEDRLPVNINVNVLGTLLSEIDETHREVITINHDSGKAKDGAVDG